MQSILRKTMLVAVLTASSTAVASDLIETATTSGGIKTFVAAAKEAGLADALKSGGPYTVFAPDDAAFQKLPPDTREALFKDKERLAQVLAYHVIPGAVKVADVKPGMVKTVEGSELKIKSDNGKVTVDEANVTQSDVSADNGVIHVIDTVVLPKQ